MRPTARQRRPRPRRAGRAGRGGSEAELSSPARHGAASLLRRRSLLPPPPPSRSLVLAGAAQTCSGAAAPARIGTGLRPRDPATGVGGVLPAGLGPSTLPGKGLPWSRGSGIREGAAGGPQPAGVFRAVRSAPGSPLPAPFSRALPLPSSLAPPALFFPILLSLSVFSLCLLSACLLSLPLPSVSPTLLSPCCPVFPHLHLLFAFFFFYLALLSCVFFFSLFPLSFPSSPRPFQLSCFPLLYPFPSPGPASLSGPRLPPGVPLPSGGKGLSGVCLLWGRRGAATATCGSPHPPEEGREETVVVRVLSSSLPAAPPGHPLSQNEVPAAWSDPCSQGLPCLPLTHRSPSAATHPFPSLVPMTPVCLSDTRLPPLTSPSVSLPFCLCLCWTVPEPWFHPPSLLCL